MNKWIKWLLVFTAAYFALHAIHALADTVQFPDGTVHNCFRTSIGTVVCI
jgi:hypothetical protein